MKYTISSILILTSLFVCSCGDKSKNSGAAEPAAQEVTAPAGPEQAAQQAADLQMQLAAVLESINDAKTAESALSNLGPIAEKFGVLGQSVQHMDKTVSPEIDAKMKELMKPSSERLSAAMEKVMPILQANPEIAKQFETAMAKMSPK